MEGLELCGGPGYSGMTVEVLETSPMEVAFVSSITLCFVVSDPLV